MNGHLYKYFEYVYIWLVVNAHVFHCIIKPLLLLLLSYIRGIAGIIYMYVLCIKQVK